jgi:acyl carrier protein
MTESGAQVSAERWFIDACRDFKLPAGAAEDDFLSIGGTSITLLHLMARAEEELGVALEPEEILEAGTLRGIAALLAR